MCHIMSIIAALDIVVDGRQSPCSGVTLEDLQITLIEFALLMLITLTAGDQVP